MNTKASAARPSGAPAVSPPGLAARAAAGPSTVFVGPGIGGDDFIRLGGDNDALPDMYVRHDAEPAPVEDLDFVAPARNYVPRLIAEIRRHRRE